MRKVGCFALFLALVSAVGLASGAVASADGIGNAGGDTRTGWYSDEAQLSPQVVAGGSFGQLWSATVDGQVYAQPLLAQGTVVVATENNKVYGLDGNTGAQQWKTDLGTPWNPADIGCGDITPSVGTTSTPVIDTSTAPGTVYLTRKTYASGTKGPAVWKMDALNLATGRERTGFPVTLGGSAQNASGVKFGPTTQQQRPGLLLMNGVIYAGFGSHCDYSPYQGWIFGVSTAGQIKARWVDNTSGLDGAGIWQSGAGLSSDGPGTILLSTGNGDSPTTPTAGSQPPRNLGNSVIRLNVQSDGTLKPVDFFTPYNASYLDTWDTDLGSAAVVALPDSFGTASVPHTAIAVGKQGVVYLLNRDNLGGAQQGTGQGDAVVQELGGYGAAFGRAGIWPGDGGYAYITTDSGQSGGGQLDAYRSGVDGSGTPTLAHVGNSADVFGFGSGPAVITSDNTTSGSALVWVIWAANRHGDGGELRAYDPVPVNGVLQERWHAPIGQATNYSTPGVGGGKLYVGTRDGKVIAFGSPVSQPLSGSGASFSATTIGQSSQQTLTLTANANVTIQGASSNSNQFALGTATPAIPTSLATGATISIPVTFTPSASGPQGGQVTISTSAGTQSFAVSGTGQTAPPKLAADKKLLTLPGIAVGGHTSGTITFSNLGAQTLTINAVHAPVAPFTLSGAPAAGATIAPNGSITITVNFDPTAAGTYNDAVGIDSDGGNLTVGISGTASTPGQLEITPMSTDYGNVVVGDTVSQSFTVSNVGGTTVTINKSKPPFGGAFANTTALDEGTTVQPGETLTESVTFAPTAIGAASGSWQITGDDSSGLHDVQFSGTGVTLLGGSGLTFGTTLIGQSSDPQTMTLTANKDLTLQNVTSSAPEFTVGTISPAVNTSVASGSTISIPVTYTPSAAGSQGGQITVTTSAGSQSFPVSGTGQIPPPKLTVDTSAVSFGSVVTGRHASQSVTYTNTGGQTLTIGAVHPPSAPFGLTDAPAAGSTIAPGASVVVTVTYDPMSAGSFTDSVGLDSDGGNVATTLSGSAVTPGQLEITPASESIDFGTVAVGSMSAAQEFSIRNIGGSPVTVTSSTTPSGQGFAAATTLDPGTTLEPGGAAVTESVTFSPVAVGDALDVWQITTNFGTYAVQFTGTGSSPTTTTTTVSGTRTSTSTTTTTTTSSSTSLRPPVRVPAAPKLLPAIVTTAQLSSIYISYVATAVADARFTLQRETGGRLTTVTHGRTIARGCVPTTRDVPRAQRCTRYVTVAAFSHHDRIGNNHIQMTGAISSRGLVPGIYRLTSVLLDTAGIPHSFSAILRITPAPIRHPPRRNRRAR